MSKYSFPQQAKLVEALAPATDAAGRTGRFITLKNTGKATVKVHVAQGNAATVALTVMQATDVSGSNAKPLGNAVPVWVNQDTGASDMLVRQADAVGFTTSGAVANKQVLIEVDPTYLDVNNGFDCIAIVTGASNAANVTQAEYILSEQRFQQAASPTARAD